MKITDEMLSNAIRCAEDPEKRINISASSVEHANSIIRQFLQSALTAALATQPDRYAAGFERAREMAAKMFELEGTEPWRAGAHIAKAIRSMEMPDE